MVCCWLWIRVESCQNDCCLILLVRRAHHCGSICARIHTKYQFGYKRQRHIHTDVGQNAQESLQPHRLTDLLNEMQTKKKFDHSVYSTVFIRNDKEINVRHKHRNLFARLSSVLIQQLELFGLMCQMTTESGTIMAESVNADRSIVCAFFGLLGVKRRSSLCSVTTRVLRRLS